MLFALLLVNALAFFLMYIDKSNAKSGCWRIRKENYSCQFS